MATRVVSVADAIHGAGDGCYAVVTAGDAASDVGIAAAFGGDGVNTTGGAGVVVTGEAL